MWTTALLLALAPAQAISPGAAPTLPGAAAPILIPGSPPCSPSPLIAPSSVAPYSAVPSTAWTDLFDQSSGWTGADGVYSIPLSRDERPCAAYETTTFFTFGDTFIGQVDRSGQRLPGSVIVNNTQALLSGADPTPGAIDFYWNAAAGQPGPMVTPNTAGGELFWPVDGLVVDGTLHLFALRMTSSFAIAGVSLLEWQVGGAPPFGSYSQVDTPLMSGLVTFGRAVFPNLPEAGAPNPDGFVYVYGLREEPLNKRLLVARVTPDRIGDFAAYRFWNGSAWVSSLGAAVPILDRLSSEFSVSPLADGRVLVCYQQDDFLGPDVTLALGTTPIGPFGPAVPVYSPPEPDDDPDLFTYGAKAHPHLSRPDRLLISYHVNTFVFAKHFQNADIYRPRFLELPLVP